MKTNWRSTWRLILPYWVSEDRWKGRALLGTIVALALGQVYLSVLFNQWNNGFYNALQDKNLPEFEHQLGVFSILAVFYIAVAVYRQYFNQMLHIRWRSWMTQKYQHAWLSNYAYYRLQVIYKSTDNPDQRIADDIDGFTSSTLTLSIGLLSSIVTLVSFTTILWGLSGTLDFALGGMQFHIPGYMFWVAIVYAMLGTRLTHLIGRKLVSLNFDQQRFEANFRFSMVRLRENAESIAFYKGEAAENAQLTERFAAIIGNWRQIMRKQKQLTWFTSGYSQIAIIFPIVVAAPRYFSGAIQLGGLMQTASAFGRVQDALSWLIDVYPSFANWKATTNRLIGFTDAMELSHKDMARTDIERATGGERLLVRNLTITLLQDEALLSNVSLTLNPGDRALITGPSGKGKTTLLRAIAGLWPYGQGAITLPQDASVLFVPQKPYLPLLPLRDIIAYPHSAGIYSQEAIEAALADVGLARLIPLLDSQDRWSHSLSLGEQQKLAFARILLQKPAVLLLDEATASLDDTAEAQLYGLLIERLPRSILVSVGHRATLRAWHTQEIGL